MTEGGGRGRRGGITRNDVGGQVLDPSRGLGMTGRGWACMVRCDRLTAVRDPLRGIGMGGGEEVG